MSALNTRAVVGAIGIAGAPSGSKPAFSRVPTTMSDNARPGPSKAGTVMCVKTLDAERVSMFMTAARSSYSPGGSVR